MKLVRRGTRKGRIEIIPMIDTVFFLLVFFMMASLSMTVYRGMPVNLPKAGSGHSARDDNAAITLARDGQTYLNRQPIIREALPVQLRALLTTNPDLVVVINADEEVVHRRVVEVMDAARMAGVARMAIAVSPGAVSRQP